VFNSKNQNSSFGLILKALRNGAADFTLRNALAFTNSVKKNKNNVSKKNEAKR